MEVPAKPVGITFSAIFNKAQTTTDGGWRVTFDLDESQSTEVNILSQLRGSVLTIAVIPQPEGAL